MIVLKNLQRLHRERGIAYLSVASLQCVKQWDLDILEPSGTNVESIIIGYSEMEWLSDNETEIRNPILISGFPLGKDSDEFPIIFVKQDNYLPLYLEQKLYSYVPFNRLVEKGSRLSKNSTKLFTMNSLRDMLFRIFMNAVPHSKWSILSHDLIKYIEKLIACYPYLSYLPVAERIEFRKKYISDQSFAWEMYFKFFYDTWTGENQTILTPDLAKVFQIDNWLGNFFDRENPLWAQVIGMRNKFMINQSQRELIYSIWKEWLRESQ